MLLIILLIILGFGVEVPPLYVNDSYLNCQFAGLTYTGRCYWYHVRSRPERYQLPNCLDSALAELENWLKVINIQNLTRCVKANLNMGYSNETIKFITTKFLGVQIDNNLT